jgi:hypothetical protein
MKPQSFYILLGATVIVTAAAGFTAWQRAAATLGTVAAETVVPGLINRVNDVVTIEVVKGKDAIKVERTAEGWAMPDRGGYPVKFETVKQNIVTMAELKTVEPKTAKPDLYSRIEVEDPAGADTKSAEMTFKDQHGNVIAAMVIGRRRYAPIGGKDMVYVRKPGDNRAWLAEGTFDIRTPAPEWLVKELSGIKDDRFKTLTFTHADGTRTVMFRKDDPNAPKPESRDGPPEIWEVEGRPTERNLRPPATVTSTASAYNFLSLDDVKPAREVEDGTPKTSSEFVAFDGLVLRSKMVEKGDTTWTMFEASTTAEAIQAIKLEAEELNKKWKGWAYKLPEYKQNFLSRKFDDLVEPVREKKEEEPKAESKGG